MTYEERLVWEKSKGFTSIELEAERLYESIDPEQFKSVDEVKSFVEKNSHLLKLVEDENGEFTLKTCLCNNTLKYLANPNGFFQISDSIYKVYNEGTISVDFDNYEELKNLDFNDVNNNSFTHVFNKMHFIEKSSPLGCLLQEPLEHKDGNEKIQLLFYPSNTLVTSEVLMNIELSAYKRYVGFVWVKKERNLQCDIKIDCSYKTPSGNWTSHMFEYSNSGTIAKEIIGYLSSGKICKKWNVNPSEVMGIYYWDVWAKQENAELARRTCNSY
jgi:hypothetical protein